MLLQHNSMYKEDYKPLFISEMDDDMIKEFSKVISEKLRHVKLAISKANVSQNKYKALKEESDEEKKRIKKGQKQKLGKKSKHEETKGTAFHLENNPLKLFDKYQDQFKNEMEEIQKPFNSLLKKAKIARSMNLKKKMEDDNYNDNN
jgi:hypothetical protein